MLLFSFLLSHLHECRCYCFKHDLVSPYLFTCLRHPNEFFTSEHISIFIHPSSLCQILAKKKKSKLFSPSNKPSLHRSCSHLMAQVFQERAPPVSNASMGAAGGAQSHRRTVALRAPTGKKHLSVNNEKVQLCLDGV